MELSSHRPNALLDGWTGREPPQAQPPGLRQLADWESIGEGRLFPLNTLGIQYGTAPYQFKLGLEVGLKWLAYAGTLAQQATERDGHVVTGTPF